MGGVGTANIKTEDAFLSMAENIDPAIYHRNFYRGKNLGSEITDAQLAAIRDGSFDDLWVGDYWDDTVQDVTWRIADINYWLNTGTVEGGEFKTSHLVIIPDQILISAKMNETDTVVGGYVNSYLVKKQQESGFSIARDKIITMFGDSNILTKQEYLSTSTKGGCVAGWIDSRIVLMNQIMVYGHGNYPQAPSDSSFGNYTTLGKTQLALFQLKPGLIINRKSYWLRDVTSSNSFACVYYYGTASSDFASSNLGIRPVFAIG